MTDEIVAAQSQVAEARADVANTVAEIEGRITGAVDGVKRKLDLMEVARANPWPALALALGAGLALSASGADRKTASATVKAGKRAPKATAKAAKQASGKAAAAAKRVVTRQDAVAAGMSRAGRESSGSGGLTGRIQHAVGKRAAPLVDEIRDAARSINAQNHHAGRNQAAESVTRV